MKIKATVNNQVLESGMVTVRERDTMKQETVPMKDLSHYFEQKFTI